MRDTFSPAFSMNGLREQVRIRDARIALGAKILLQAGGGWIKRFGI